MEDQVVMQQEEIIPVTQVEEVQVALPVTVELPEAPVDPETVGRFFRVNGTNGSGKSTVVKRVMEAYETIEPIRGILPFKSVTREIIIGYLCTAPNLRSLLVCGTYQSATGGLDRWSKAGTFPDVYRFIRKNLQLGLDVIGEGITHTGDRNWIGAMIKDGYDAIACNIHISLEECVDGVQSRRSEKQRDSLEDVHRLEEKFRTLHRSYGYYEQYNVPWVILTRDEMPVFILDQLSYEGGTNFEFLDKDIQDSRRRIYERAVLEPKKY